MGLRTRSFRLGLCLIALLAIVALPGFWPGQDPGSTLGPTLAWAGGTPDETLHPQPTPPQQSGKWGMKPVPYEPSGTVAIEASTRRPDPTASSRATTPWGTFWMIVRLTVLRI